MFDHHHGHKNQNSLYKTAVKGSRRQLAILRHAFGGIGNLGAWSAKKAGGRVEPCAMVNQEMGKEGRTC